MTDKQLDRDIKNYIKEIKSLLICDYKTQNKFIGDIKSRLDEHIENGLINSIDDVYMRMGTPQDIAKAFFENADVKKVKKKMNITKIILIGVIIALVIWAAGITAVVIDEMSTEGYFIEELYDVDDNKNPIGELETKIYNEQGKEIK